jgi:protease-4
MSVETSLEADQLVDRRRLRRRVSFWRALTFLVAIAALIAVAYRSSGALGPFGGRHIARVQVSGVITDDKKQQRLLKRLAENRSVEAVIVHINSPGGTTTGGEALFEGLRELSAKKPVVSVFGTMATSAAYIAGLATDHIVARGNTVTGSVGVIFQWAELSQLLDKLGVKVNEVKSGSLKAVPSMFAPLDERGRQLTVEMVAESQRWFVGLVSDRRKIDPATVPGLVEGRIFSGRQALDSRLVDAIGGEREAVRWLEDKRGIAKGLKIEDWKPRGDSDWSVTGAIAATARALGLESLGVLERLADQGALARLQLDGLVSVWHAPSN